MTYQFDNLRNLNILNILFLKYQKGENIFTKLIAKFLSSKFFFYLVYMLTSGFRSCNFQLWEFSKLSYSQQAILNLNQYIWWETIGFIIYRFKSYYLPLIDLFALHFFEHQSQSSLHNNKSFLTILFGQNE